MSIARSGQTFFLGIGAEKAGTSWMHRQLAQHPEVWTPPHKEIHYFDTLHLEKGSFYRASKYRTLQKQLDRFEWADLAEKPARLERLRWFAKQALVVDPDDEWYVGLFEEARAKHRVFGEVTPAYAALPLEGFEHIAALEPNARMILLLRDPVTRLWSAIRYFSNNRPGNTVMGSIDEMIAFARRPMNAAKTRYDLTIEHLRSVFSEEQVLIGFYEDIFSDRANQARFLESLAEFLGIPLEGLPPADTTKAVNASPPSSIPEELRGLIAEEYRPVVDRVEALLGSVPDSWRAHP